MSAPRYSQLASKVLARYVNHDVPPAPSEEAREEAIAAIERAMENRGRWNRRVRWVGGLSAAAALFVGVIGASATLSRSRAGFLPNHALLRTQDAGHAAQIVAYFQGGGARVVGTGPEAGAGDVADRSDGWALGPGNRVVTPAGGRATLAFSNGTSVTLSEASDVAVMSQGPSERLRLDQGMIDLQVAKQLPDHRFLVDTADTEVEVRGTRFRVSIVPPDRECEGGVLTRVAVTEGVVVVRHLDKEVRVGAGERWPAGCVHDSINVASGASTSASAGHGVRGPVNALNAPTTYASSLSDQNDLFSEAVAAKRRGDVLDAVAAYERLMARYPSSPLAESAAVERMRVLRDVSAAKAKAAADLYLVKYPNGYARAEAESVAAASP
jgi:hypothetical protein